MHVPHIGLIVTAGLSLLALGGASLRNEPYGNGDRGGRANAALAAVHSTAYLPLTLADASPEVSPGTVERAIGRDGPLGRWANFSSTTPASAIALTPDGRTLWQASSGGAVQWDILSGRPTVFTALDGLLSNGQLEVAVGPDGSTWFAAEDGVSRRDSAGAWTVVSRRDVPAFNQLRTVGVAPDGTVYAGGWGGLSQRIDDSSWTPVPGAPNGIIHDIAFAPDGTIWVATDHGADQRWTDGTWHHHGLSDRSTAREASIAVAADGTAWLGTIDSNCGSATVCGAAARISLDGTVTVWTRDDGLPMSAVNGVAVDADGGAWFGAYAHPTTQVRTDGLAHLSADGTWSTIAPTADAALDQVLDLAIEGSGTLWAATGRGVARRAADGSWRTWSTVAVDSLPIPDAQAGVVFDAASDSTGRLWFGTLSGLVLREADGAWRHLPVPSDVQAQFVEAVAVDARGDVWVGTRHGLFIYRPGGDPAWREPLGGRFIVDGWVQDIAIGPDGDVWVGLFDGLFHRSRPDGGWTIFSGLDLLPDDNVLDVEVDRDGLAWIATISGVVTIDRSDNVTRLVAPTAPACQTRDIGIGPDGTVWFGPNGFGCYTISRRAPDGTWSHIPYGTHPLESVADIAVDAAGNTWFGSMWERGGIAVHRPDGTWQHFDPRDGLAGGSVWSVLAAVGTGGENDVWVGTFNGLTRIRQPGTPATDPTAAAMPPTPTAIASATPDRSGGLPPVRGRWRHETDANGVVALDMKRGDAHTLWAATWGGLVAWDLATGRSTKFTVADGLPDHTVSAVRVADDGTVWIGTRSHGAARRWPDGRIERLPSSEAARSNDILAIEIAPDGSVWFGHGRGADRLPTTGIRERFDFEDGTIAPTITSMAFDAKGNGFFGSYASGLSVRSADGRWSRLTERQGLRSDQISTVAAAPDGAVWIASYGYADNRAVRFVDILKPDGSVSPLAPVLPGGDPVIRRIRFDAAGQAWIATSQGLLAPDPAGGWHLEPVDDSARPGADDVFIGSDGAVWVATAAGPARRTPDGRFAVLSRPDELPSNDVYRMTFDPAGRLWAAMRGGLAVRETDGRWRRVGVDDGAPVSTSVADVAVGADGAVWVSGDKAVSRRAADGTWTRWSAADGLPDGPTGRLVLAPDGTPWLAVHAEPGRGGVEGVTTLGADGRWTVFTKADGLPRIGAVHAIAIDPDGLPWVGMRLWQSLPPAPPVNLARRTADERWEAMTVPGSSELEHVNALAFDAADNLWAALYGGVAMRTPVGAWTTWADDAQLAFASDVVHPTARGDLWFSDGYDRARVRRADGSWASVGRADGLASEGMRDIAVAADGSVWFAGGGISVLEPETR